MKLYGMKEVIPEGTYIVCDLHMCPYMHVAICTASQLHMNVFFRSGITDNVSYSGGHNMLPDCQTRSTRV